MNGAISSEVAKLKTSPKVSEMGKAGSAFLNMASSSRVTQSPCEIEKKEYIIIPTTAFNLRTAMITY